MLQIQDITKTYITGDLTQIALDHVSLNFRDSEFVSILGPSGSGKSTLLNIVGGLDRYDSGDLIINGVSTKKYKDRNWDSYRNHSIGFVFQSYNLISHLTLLANVELALTIGGVSKRERQQRALDALEEVGLKEQAHKKPAQLSGGQMQRVAIARALVNDPEILLADEPTGALDSDTSIQVMELLKKVAHDRLVVMVTHNPELAEKYSTRIVRLRDGKIISDSEPFSPKDDETNKPLVTSKAGMSLATSLSLSFSNLRTKRARTFLTAFAGSIGIIGIALILSLSTGVNQYIDTIQEETLSSYPITINSTTMDTSALQRSMMGSGSMSSAQRIGSTDDTDYSGRTEVHVDTSDLSASEAISTSVTENDLTAFKKYLEDENSEIRQYINLTDIHYSYALNFEVLSKASDGTIVSSGADTDAVIGTDSGEASEYQQRREMAMTMFAGEETASAENFSELMTASDGTSISDGLRANYDIVYGNWPSGRNEVVLALGYDNSIDAGILYQLGLITADEYRDMADTIADGKDVTTTFDYADVAGHSFYLVPSCDLYEENEDGTFSHRESDGQIPDSAMELKISGIVRAKKDAEGASISTAVGYTSALTKYLISYTDESPVVKAQEADPDINVLTGLPFGEVPERMKAGTTDSTAAAASEARAAGVFTSASAADTASVENTTAEGPAAMDAATAQAAVSAIETATYESNMTAFGKTSLDSPSSISIYPSKFGDKDLIADCITNYNRTVDEDHQITYTDYVAMMTSSITSIINVISYVLIGFVGVSLVVSCIMIGIITNISVLERTKEIGILRALGASKRNVTDVFNAETIIIGFISGILGIVISWLLTFPMNAILRNLIGSESVSAYLQPFYAIILIAISVLITLIGGLIPARGAAKKDPVAALRSE